MRKKLPFIFVFLFLVSVATVSAQLNIGELLENTGLDAFFVDIVDANGNIASDYGLLYLRIILFIVVFALFYGVSNLVLANIEKRPRMFISLGLGLLSVVAIPAKTLQTLVSGYAVGLFVALSLVLILGAVFIGHKIGRTRAGRFGKGILFLFAGYFVEGILAGGLANLGGAIPAPSKGIGLGTITSLLSLVSMIMVFMGFWYIFTSFGPGHRALRDTTTGGQGLKSIGKSMEELAEGGRAVKKGWREMRGTAKKEERLNQKMENIESSIEKENDAIIVALGDLQQTLNDKTVKTDPSAVRKILQKIKKTETDEVKELKRVSNLLSKWDRVERKLLAVAANQNKKLTQPIQNLISGSGKITGTERNNINSAAAQDMRFQRDLQNAITALSKGDIAQAQQSISNAAQAKVAENNAMRTVKNIQKRLGAIENAIKQVAKKTVHN